MWEDHPLFLTDIMKKTKLSFAIAQNLVKKFGEPSAQKMPCGYYVRRKKDDGFKRRGYFNKWSIEWLDFLAHRDRLNIVHAHSQGEHRIGRYPVDGFDLQSKTIFEFKGCYWHGHRCTTNTHTNERCGVPLEVLFERTGQKVRYLEEEGFKVVQIWECECRNLRKTEELQAFLATYEQYCRSC